MIFKPINVGKINKEGKAEYIERVANVTKYPDKKIVEFKNNYELIDNGIITTEIYEKFKNNDNIYNLTVTEYLRLRDISSKESYNSNSFPPNSRYSLSPNWSILSLICSD